MTQTPAFLLASAALLVAAVSGGLAIQEAGRAHEAARSALARIQAIPQPESAIDDRLHILLSERLDPLSNEIARLHTEISRMRAANEALTTVEQRIAALETAQANAVKQSALDALRDEIATLRPTSTALETIKRQIAALETRLQDVALQTSDSPAEAAQAELTRLRNQITEIQTRTDAATAAIVESLRNEIATLRQTTATAHTIEGLNRRLDEVRNQIAALTATAPETQSALTHLRERLEALEARPTPTIPSLEQLLAEASPTAREALGRIGLAATVANPQPVMEAISTFIQEQRRLEAQGRPIPPALLDETFSPESGALRAGPPNATRRLAIFTDHNCPFCRRAIPLIQDLLRQGNVEIIIHEMPILSPQSHEAALISAAAARLDPHRAFELYVSVGTHEGRLDGATMLEKAAGLGFDREALRREAAREETRQTVDRSIDLARRLGVTGTPGFIAHDLLIQGLQPDQILQALTRPR